MSTTKPSYHHGDLRSALLDAALALLDESGETELSLRAVARRAGVSAAAPYRHYADREALASAVAGVGYRDLAVRLSAAHPAPATADELAAVAVAYVQFALERPALFRIMFGEPCDRDNDERVAASGAVELYLRSIVERVMPDGDPEDLSAGVWALVHGLAFLYLDGKLDPAELPGRVQRIVGAVLGSM